MAATKVLAQPDSKKNKQIGELAAGTVVLAMDTRMDRRGHSFIYHRGAGVPGWSPTHSDDNMPVLVPVDANASQARTSMTGGTRVQASGRASSATITPGSHMVVKVKAPFFRLHERDNQVQGLLEKGEVIGNPVERGAAVGWRHAGAQYRDTLAAPDQERGERQCQYRRTCRLFRKLR